MGDTIPNVIAALFPSLSDLPFLWLLTNRQAVIMVCTLCFSYPLSLYRDIAKVKEIPPFPSSAFVDYIQVSKSVDVGTFKHGCRE